MLLLSRTFSGESVVFATHVLCNEINIKTWHVHNGRKVQRGQEFPSAEVTKCLH